MAVYFTSAVHHGDTTELDPEKWGEYFTQINDEGASEHVLYLANVGQFSSTELDELNEIAKRILGPVGLAKWQADHPRLVGDEPAGNSGTH